MSRFLFFPLPPDPAALPAEPRLDSNGGKRFFVVGMGLQLITIRRNTMLALAMRRKGSRANEGTRLCSLRFPEMRSSLSRTPDVVACTRIRQLSPRVHWNLRRICGKLEISPALLSLPPFSLVNFDTSRRYIARLDILIYYSCLPRSPRPVINARRR